MPYKNIAVVGAGGNGGLISKALLKEGHVSPELGRNALEMSRPALFTCIRDASAGRAPPSGRVLSMFRPASHRLGTWDMIRPKEDEIGIGADQSARATASEPDPYVMIRPKRRHPDCTNGR
ncbi:hypothetical protein FIBSPDRAFT_882470 [Athelia psychrophila]|uniref:Uncharacterized protein n=1 Tax=Athelia psychrophila TaxID=1759441 RepID=A0A166VE60_9AGAM|nr:hypothetical protein FIBSPDRAFT_882470 [Fibularhizoctonia sp. CBS 109695]